MIDDEIMARYALVPPEIMARACHDVYIHAAIRQWIDSDQTVEWLLIRLVLLLSEQYGAMHQTVIDAVQRCPAYGPAFSLSRG